MAKGGRGMVVATLCVITLICSAIFIYTTFYLKSEGRPQLFIPAYLAIFLALHIYAFLLSVVGMLYPYVPERSQKVFQNIYSLMLILLGISILVTIFVFFVILPGPDTTALEKNPKWFRSGLVEGAVWTAFTTCMKKNDYCEKQMRTNVASLKTEFVKSCCQSPTNCGNQTAEKYMDLHSEKKDDCSKWSNNQKDMCYGCDSCKEKVLQTFKLIRYNFILVTLFYGFLFSVGWWLGFE